MRIKKVMEQLLEEIQDLNFRRVYGNVSKQEKFILLQKSHAKVRQLHFLEKGVMK